MPFSRFIVCIAFLLLGGRAFAEEAQHRVALVIGNSAYARAPLANPVNDARLIAAKLKAQGFEVFDAYDASQRDMKRAVQTFAATLRQRGKDVAAFIFYAGHGVQVKGENYLIPVDAKIESEADVDIDAVSLSSIMSMLENTETRLAVVVLDACRNNPFGYARGGSRGLARVDAPSGSLVAFSTSPGKAALDGPAGGNSYYTAALAQAMAEPGLKIEDAFKRVRIAVREQTKGEQTPWESTSLTGDFYPAGKSELPLAKVSAALPPEPPAELKQTAGQPELRPFVQYEDRAQRLVRTLKGHEHSVWSVAFSPNGNLILSGGLYGDLKLWSTSTGEEIRSFLGHTNTIWSIAFSPDGRLALSGSSDGTMKLWDVATGSEIKTFTGHTATVSAVAFLPDGHFALSGSWDQLVKLWNLDTGQEVRDFIGHTSPVSSIAVSHDGRMLLSGSADKSLRLWNIENGDEIEALRGQVADGVQSVTFSPDDTLAAAGSCAEKDPTDIIRCTKGSLKLWDLKAKREIGSFDGHLGYVASVRFSINGRFLLSGSSDKTMKLWDALTHKEIRTFDGLAGTKTKDLFPSINAVSFSPEGRLALSGSADGLLKLWDVSEWTQPQEARR